MKRIKCPCKGCTPDDGRTMMCHSYCQSYIEWNKEHEEFKRMRNKEKDMDGFFRNHKINTIESVKKYGQMSHLSKRRLFSVKRD